MDPISDFTELCFCKCLEIRFAIQHLCQPSQEGGASNMPHAFTGLWLTAPKPGPAPGSQLLVASWPSTLWHVVHNREQQCCHEGSPGACSVSSVVPRGALKTCRLCPVPLKTSSTVMERGRDSGVTYIHAVGGWIWSFQIHLYIHQELSVKGGKQQTALVGSPSRCIVVIMLLTWWNTSRAS